MWTAFRIEFIKNHRSFLGFFPLVGVTFAILSTGFSMLAWGQGFAPTPYAWHAVYVTGLMAPICALIANIPETREVAANFGGMHFRPINQRKLQLARFAVLACGCLELQAFCFGSLWFFGAPATTFLLMLYAWLGMLGVVGLLNGCARKIGYVPTLIVSVGWQLLAVIGSYSIWWYLYPPAWALRIMLVPMDINVNSTPLEADSPLREENPALGIVLCILLMLIGGWIASVAQPRTHTGSKPQFFPTVTMPKTGFIDRQSHKLPMVAFWFSLRSSGLYVLVLLTILLLFATTQLYSPSVTVQLFTYFLLPLGSFIAATLSWRVSKGCLPLMCMESAVALRAFVTAHVILVMTIIGCATVLTIPTIATTTLWLSIGTLFFLIALALTIRFNPTVSLAVGFTVTLFSLTIGGDVLADTSLWVFGIAAWPISATSIGQVSFALSTSILLIIMAGMWLHRCLIRYVQ